MANIKDTIRIYPKSNSTYAVEKVNTENNLALRSKSLVRNHIISGCKLRVTGDNVELLEGEMLIAGYRIKVNLTSAKEALVIGNTSTLTEGTNIYAKLSRSSTKELNPYSDATNPIEFVTSIPASTPESDETSSWDSDYLFIGTVPGSGIGNDPDKTVLKAQDIYVNGNSNNLNMGNNESYKYNYKHPNGTTLDEFLATMIISDGQF